MFREMRRKKQLLPFAESAALLEAGTSGVLAVAGEDGYPYAVPLSYAYDRGSGKIWFHCARTGHKLDAIRQNSKASFCVIAQDDVVPEKYTSLYRSVIAFGRMRILEDEAEKRAAIECLALRYAPDDPPERRQAYIVQDYDRVCVLELTIEHLTGKEGIELTKERES